MHSGPTTVRHGIGWKRRLETTRKIRVALHDGSPMPACLETLGAIEDAGAMVAIVSTGALRLARQFEETTGAIHADDLRKMYEDHRRDSLAPGTSVHADPGPAPLAWIDRAHLAAAPRDALAPFLSSWEVSEEQIVQAETAAAADLAAGPGALSRLMAEHLLRDGVAAIDPVMAAHAEWRALHDRHDMARRDLALAQAQVQAVRIGAAQEVQTARHREAIIAQALLLADRMA